MFVHGESVQDESEGLLDENVVFDHPAGWLTCKASILETKMDPATIELIKDAIKILGPATIAALATYMAAKSQFELRLKEIEKGHQFRAREHLFRYYKDRQTQLSHDYTKLIKSLEEDLGYVAGYTKTGVVEDSGIIKTMANYIEMRSSVTLMEIDITMRDMDKNDLDVTPEYERLKSCKDKISNLAKDTNFPTLQKNMLTLVEANRILQFCNQMLMQRQMEKMFLKYMEG